MSQGSAHFLINAMRLSPCSFESGPETVTVSTPVKLSHHSATVYRLHAGQRKKTSVCSSPMMRAPARVAGDGCDAVCVLEGAVTVFALHGSHSVRSHQVFEDLVFGEGIYNDQAGNEHAPIGEHDCVLVGVQPFDNGKLAVADLDLA